MTHHEPEPAKLMRLRRDAEMKLKSGGTPATLGWPLGVDVLGLIHKLASSPASAVDALKMLHEMQVHQVELDLQHEQIEATQRELGEELAQFRELYDHAPVGYVSVGPKGDILSCNIAAARLLSVGQDEAHGRDLHGFLASASRPVLLGMLQGLRANGSRGDCEVLVGADGATRKVRLLARLPPSGESVLIVLLDLPPGR